MNNMLPENIARFIPASSQKAVASASAKLVTHDVGNLQEQAGKIPVLPSIFSFPQVQMVVQFGKNLLKIK